MIAAWNGIEALDEKQAQSFEEHICHLIEVWDLRSEWMYKLEPGENQSLMRYS